MTAHLLSFELNANNDELLIHGDEAGLQLLSKILNSLVSQTDAGYFNHEHLMTPQWGGIELSSANKGGIIIEHVKVYCWKGDQPQK